eukprot:gene2486-2827_t
MVSIEEIDIDSNIASQLYTNTWQLTGNTSDDTATTILTYQAMDTGSVEVTVTLSHSNDTRSFSFANLNTTLPPNSINLSVNITNWQYQSSLNTLRAVFKTSLAIAPVPVCPTTPIFEQIVQNGLDKSLIYVKSINKDGVAFYSHFPTRSLSNGQPTYAYNEVINRTAEFESKTDIFIGIHMPHCSSCLINSDHTMLQEDITRLLPCDKSSSSQQESQEQSESPSSKKNNTWVVAVIVVVVVVAVGVASITSFLLIKRRRSLVKFNARLTRIAQEQREEEERESKRSFRR